MALFTLEWVGNMNGADKYYSRTYPEGDSETFKKWAPVVYDDSEDGVVEIPSSSGVPSTTPDVMLGLALQDASGTSDDDLDVLIVRPGDIFSGILASDQSTPVAPADDNVIGELYGLVKLATAATTADAGAAAGTEWAVYTGDTHWLRVLDYDPRDSQRRVADAVTTTNYVTGDRVLFTFINAVSERSARQT